MEKTLSIIKPDAVEKLDTKIKDIFERNNLKIKESKKYIYLKMKLQSFIKYINQTFYNDLCSYLSSGPIVVMILEGENAVIANRKIMGSTNPKDAEENTIENYTDFQLIKIQFMVLTL